VGRAGGKVWVYREIVIYVPRTPLHHLTLTRPNGDGAPRPRPVPAPLRPCTPGGRGRAGAATLRPAGAHRGRRRAAARARRARARGSSGSGARARTWRVARGSHSRSRRCWRWRRRAAPAAPVRADGGCSSGWRGRGQRGVAGVGPAARAAAVHARRRRRRRAARAASPLLSRPRSTHPAPHPLSACTAQAAAWHQAAAVPQHAAWAVSPRGAHERAPARRRQRSPTGTSRQRGRRGRAPRAAPPSTRPALSRRPVPPQVGVHRRHGHAVQRGPPGPQDRLLHRRREALVQHVRGGRGGGVAGLPSFAAARAGLRAAPGARGRPRPRSTPPPHRPAPPRPCSCDPADQCCEGYEACVSCCLAPANGAKERLPEVSAARMGSGLRAQAPNRVHRGGRPRAGALRRSTARSGLPSAPAGAARARQEGLRHVGRRV
jgi:hypothetical protein